MNGVCKNCRAKPISRKAFKLCAECDLACVQEFINVISDLAHEKEAILNMLLTYQEAEIEKLEKPGMNKPKNPAMEAAEKICAELNSLGKSAFRENTTFGYFTVEMFTKIIMSAYDASLKEGWPGMRIITRIEGSFEEVLFLKFETRDELDRALACLAIGEGK